jgi:3-phenylpropionate/cinnamic acid dioxygenase small subunit
MPDARAAADHVEIAQLLQRYGRALDDRRFADLDALFAADAEVDYQIGDTTTRGPWREVGGTFPRFLDVFLYTTHLISPPVLELRGDEASADSRLIAVHGWERLAGGRGAWFVFGVYRDTLVRTPEGWRIRRREFRGLGDQGELPARRELRRK